MGATHEHNALDCIASFVFKIDAFFHTERRRNRNGKSERERERKENEGASFSLFPTAAAACNVLSLSQIIRSEWQERINTHTILEVRNVPLIYDLYML